MFRLSQTQTQTQHHTPDVCNTDPGLPTADWLTDSWEGTRCFRPGSCILLGYLVCCTTWRRFVGLPGCSVSPGKWINTWMRCCGSWGRFHSLPSKSSGGCWRQWQKPENMRFYEKPTWNPRILRLLNGSRMNKNAGSTHSFFKEQKVKTITRVSPRKDETMSNWYFWFFRTQTHPVPNRVPRFLWHQVWFSILHPAFTWFTFSFFAELI